MARQEEPREDLLREATALVARVEMMVDGFDESILAGFRRDGAASFFFGQQIVYQFNTAGELRRGYIDGQLYKAECGRLSRLTRQRTAESVDLVRHDLTPDETGEFLSRAHERLQVLCRALAAEQYHIVGQVPAEKSLVGRVIGILRLFSPIALASSPRVK